MASHSDKVLPLHQATVVPQCGVRVTLASIAADGTLWVADAAGQRFPCDLLQAGVGALQLAPGDALFAQPPDGSQRGVVLGRIVRYAGAAAAPANVRLEATESLSLKCGDASIELRADGKLMVKGDDVLVKARGTQRIKAGSVNIN